MVIPVFPVLSVFTHVEKVRWIDVGREIFGEKFGLFFCLLYISTYPSVGFELLERVDIWMLRRGIYKLPWEIIGK